MLPKQYGVAESPLFCLKGLAARCGRGGPSADYAPLQRLPKGEQPPPLQRRPNVPHAEDSDVVEAREIVNGGKTPFDAPIVIQDLHKSFGKKEAVGGGPSAA